MLRAEIISTIDEVAKEVGNQNIFPTSYLQGLVYAVCASPEIPMPEQWLRWAFKAELHVVSQPHIDVLADQLMQLLQLQLIEMRSEKVMLPKTEKPILTLDQHSDLAQWLAGLLAGHSQLDSVWRAAWENALAKKPDKMATLQRDLKHCLMMFSTFANVPLALEHARQTGNHQLPEKLPKIFSSLPRALISYVSISGELASFLPDQFEVVADKDSH